MVERKILVLAEEQFVTPTTSRHEKRIRSVSANNQKLSRRIGCSNLFSGQRTDTQKNKKSK